MGFRPKFQDNPEHRAYVLQNAERAKDKYGNTLLKVGDFWFSQNFDRLLELAERAKNKQNRAIICRTADERVFSLPYSRILYGRARMRGYMNDGYYLFMEPTVQVVY